MNVIYVEVAPSSVLSRVSAGWPSHWFYDVVEVEETVEECQYEGDRAVDDSLEELYAEISALTCEVEYLRAKVEAAEKAECDW